MTSRLGQEIRTLRRKAHLSQAELARELGISPSYLNLIENDKRQVTAPLLIQIAQRFSLDLRELGGTKDAALLQHLREVFADPVFEGTPVTVQDLTDFAAGEPVLAHAMVRLFHAFTEARLSGDSLAARVVHGDPGDGTPAVTIPSEEVSELIQAHQNHFPELERAAESLWKKARFQREELYANLVHHLLDTHRVKVRVHPHDELEGVFRRYDEKKRVVHLSELLPTRSRKFQLAHQLALIEHRELLAKLSESPLLTSHESHALARAALANYFASAVLMPYGDFYAACEEVRYDLDVIGRRFRVGFEQVCHRVTTLRRPGASGVPFHMLRTDVAGNISKRFSGSGIPFARFSGACPKWNVFSAFSTPGKIRIQVSRMPDDKAYFCLARTVQRDSGSYHRPQLVMAIGLGCEVKYAKRLVYADGVDLDREDTFVPVGVTCRLCERTECGERAFPSIRHPLRIDENVRRESVFMPSTR